MYTYMERASGLAHSREEGVDRQRGRERERERVCVMLRGLLSLFGEESRAASSAQVLGGRVAQPAD